MSAARLLEIIEDGIVQHGGDLDGWTRRDDETLQLFDGRVTLRAELLDEEESSEVTVHAHVFTKLHEHDDEELDACVFGLGDNNEEALTQAATIWMTCIAGPVRSFIDNKPVCMTCQAGVHGGDVEQGYSPGDYGLPNLRAYVGPAVGRGFDDAGIQGAIDDTRPWFRYAAESAAPRKVHLAKATIMSQGKQGWSRELEIDGHEVSHSDPDWPAGVTGPEVGYLVRYAVFEFPKNSNQLTQRAELERTIHYFIDHFHKYEYTETLLEEMAEKGFDPDLSHEVESISTIAFGRMYFEGHGVEFATTVIRARESGEVEVDIPIMSLPAYSRARAIAAERFESMPEEQLQALCLYSAESQAILSAFEDEGENLDLSSLNLFPCVIPDRNVSQTTMDLAMARLHEMLEADRPAKKPWWKFW